MIAQTAIAIGLGCRRGAAAADIATLVRAAVALLPVSSRRIAVEPGTAALRCQPLLLTDTVSTPEGSRSGTARHEAGLFTITDKRGEPGLAEAAAMLGLPLTFLDTSVLTDAAARAHSRSRRVEDMFGLPGIAETAALAGAGDGATLWVPKMSSPTATCAIAGSLQEFEWVDRLEGENVVVAKASADDVSAIEAIIHDAYHKYVRRLGKLPAPMTAAYGELVDAQTVFVLRAGGDLLGCVVLVSKGDALEVANLAVDPSAQGRGLGRKLMEYAERMARARGLAALTLYTHESMHENIALYARLGFVETDRRTEDGFDRVFFRKNLAEPGSVQAASRP